MGITCAGTTAKAVVAIGSIVGAIAVGATGVGAGGSRPARPTPTDTGIAFDPTKKEDADTTLSAEERPIGGLGIFLVRQLMDVIDYKRSGNKNVLTLQKKLDEVNASN